MSRTPEERFWPKVEKTDECWLWTASRYKSGGYGQFTVDSLGIRAHRFAYELLVGPIPSGMCVLHRCDNPPCVRPDHLFLGTQHDNAKDRTAKGRTGPRLSGDKHPTRTPERRQRYETVLALLAEGVSKAEIARRVGLTQRSIHYIVSGRFWTFGSSDVPRDPVPKVGVPPELDAGDLRMADQEALHDPGGEPLTGL